MEREKNERVASTAACLTVLTDGCHPLLHSGSIINSPHAHYLFCSLLHFDSISFALFSICSFVIPLAGHIIHSLVRFQYVTTMTLARPMKVRRSLFCLFCTHHDRGRQSWWWWWGRLRQCNTTFTFMSLMGFNCLYLPDPFQWISFISYQFDDVNVQCTFFFLANYIPKKTVPNGIVSLIG